MSDATIIRSNHLLDRTRRVLFEGIDPIRLDTYRRGLAFAFLVYVTYLMFNASEWLTDDGFHLTADTQLLHAARPWPTMPKSLVPWFALALYGSGICLILGKLTRPASWIFLACAIYVQRVDALTAFALNKLTIVGFAILALAPPPRRVRFADGRTVMLQSAWPVRVLQATVLIMYCTSAVCKGVLGDWLRDPNVVWSVVQGVFRTDLSSLLLRMMPKWFFSLLMYFVLAFEFFAPVLLINKRLRPWGIAAGILLHVGLASMMSTVFFFSLQMIMYYILFLPDSTLHQFRSWYTSPTKDATTDLPADNARLRDIKAIATNEATTDAEKVASIRRLLDDLDEGTTQ
ncbi:MAG: HTTM domain-containing protein [Planctomycetales bacterium]|nr:HTTM domain-containing protein [Planctomycetales bacterium]